MQMNQGSLIISHPPVFPVNYVVRDVSGDRQIRPCFLACLFIIVGALALDVMRGWLLRKRCTVRIYCIIEMSHMCRGH